jgi:excisionase family DNA binding protein
VTAPTGGHVRHADVRLLVPSAGLAALADQLAPLVEERLARGREDEPRYMTVAEAATYMRCSKQRVYDLVSSRRLRPRKDGRRVLLARSELARHLKEGPLDR